VDRREFLLAAAAAPAALRRAHAVSYVTADLESHVAVVDLAAGRVVRRLPTAPGPRSIERVGERYVVAHTGVGTLTVLGVGELALDEPRYTAGTRDGRYAFVSDSGSAQLVAVDVVRGGIVARTKLKQWPRHLSLAPDGRRLRVALGTASPEVAVVDVRDPRRPTLLGYERVGFAAHDVGFAPSGRLWVTSGDAGLVSAHGVRLAADAAPQHVTFAHGLAYVTSGDDGTLRIYDERTARLLHTIRVPRGSYNVQHVAGDVVTPSLNVGTLTVVGGARVRVARSCHDAA
jgi:DNA-binding beta-propeller fold protein YncE